jgi:hypothetical protein
MISVSDIEARLRARAEELAHELLPAARREGAYCKAGSIDGEAGNSLVLYLAGERRGKWRDYASDEHGDMLDLIAATQRLESKAAAVAWAKAWLGIEDTPRKAPSSAERLEASERHRARVLAQQKREAEERASKIQSAKALYLAPGSVAIAGTPVEWYLRRRLLEPARVKPGEPATWPNVLRYNREVWHGREQRKFPAMLAAVYLADGTQVATHRTYLQNSPRHGWVKIDCPDCRMVLGPSGGGFIPINKGASGKSMRLMPAGERVFITEGIEDALVVRMKIPDARVICGISLSNIGAIVLPPAAKEIVLVCDRDENERAQAELERAIGRQQARGLKVFIAMPPPGIKDYNDWLRVLAAAGKRGDLA